MDLIAVVYQLFYDLFTTLYNIVKNNKKCDSVNLDSNNYTYFVSEMSPAPLSSVTLEAARMLI